MALANQLFFIVFSIIALALFGSAIYQYHFNKNITLSFCWPLSAGLFSFSCLCFGIALWIHPFLLTVANATYLLSFLVQVFLFRSWNQSKITDKHVLMLSVIFIPLIAYYDHLRVMQDTFKHRVALITITQEILLVWQLFELVKYFKQSRDNAVKWLIVLVTFSLFGQVSRTLWVVAWGDQTNFFLYAHDMIASTLLWVGFGSAILVFVALGNFYLKKVIRYEMEISNSLSEAIEENQKIITLLKEKERLIYGLLKANKTAATGALSASIAHELNQPLGASSLNIQFLKMKLEEGLLNPELGKKILDSLEKDNTRAALIVRSLRSIFTESESSAQNVQLGDLISKVLEVVKPEVKSRNIQIQLKVIGDPVIKVNPVEIEQVILNLVNNSIQALANSGTLQRRIKIEASQDSQSASFTIADNGPGVSAVFRSQLFELLSTTKQTGMGLGLWLCRHIVTRYMGTIEYMDGSDGGAKFVVQLPNVRQ